MLATVTHAAGSRLRVGFVVNPWAGIGGPAGMRGSDGESVRRAALAVGSEPRAAGRARRFLAVLAASPDAVRIDCRVWGGAMGADVAAEAGFTCRAVGNPAGDPCTADDTRRAVAALLATGIDLLVFVGGDGTARDVFAVVGDQVPVLGVPAGVKMYSGVFAVSPEAAAAVVLRMAAGRAVPIERREVRDIDEEAFRHDRVASRWFGELRVPGVGNLVQHVKCSPPEDEAGARRELGAWVADHLDPGVLYLVGTGGTPAAVLEALGLRGSLLGVDAVLDGRLLATDLDARQLGDLLDSHREARVLVTATGGQGFLFGRGNQQFTPCVLRRVGGQGVVALATPGKLATLGGRPLLVDTGDPELDRLLAGWREVMTGPGEQVLYPVVAAADLSAETTSP